VKGVKAICLENNCGYAYVENQGLITNAELNGS